MCTETFSNDENKVTNVVKVFNRFVHVSQNRMKRVKSSRVDETQPKWFAPRAKGPESDGSPTGYDPRTTRYSTGVTRN